jgi:hypothetical protein
LNINDSGLQRNRITVIYTKRIFVTNHSKDGRIHLSAENEPKASKKTTVNLFLESSILAEIREEAKQKGVSLNSRINSILTKYVQFYKRAEEVDDTCIIPKKYFQFVIDNIEEEKNIAQISEMHRLWIPALFNDLNVSFTLENFIKYAFRQVGINSRTIDNVTYHLDEDGNHILAFTHRFGLKWSRAASFAVATVIEELLQYRTERSIYPGSFVIKVLERR